MSASSIDKELTLTIIFGCLATILALAGIVVACVQYRSYIRASDTTPTLSSLETGLPLSPISPGGLDSAPKANEGQRSSTTSYPGATRAQDGHGSREIACGSIQSVASA
jgi:hypothetical protein